MGCISFSEILGVAVKATQSSYGLMCIKVGCLATECSCHQNNDSVLVAVRFVPAFPDGETCFQMTEQHFWQSRLNAYKCPS